MSRTCARLAAGFGATIQRSARHPHDPWRDLEQTTTSTDARQRRSRQRRPDGRVSGVTGREAASRRPSPGLRHAPRARPSSMPEARGVGRRRAAAYDRGWHRLPRRRCGRAGQRRGGRATQYLASALVLAAAEDKLNRGAIVASPSAPWAWGDEVEDLSLAVRRLPPGVVARLLPVRHRPVGDGRPGRRAPHRRLALRGPAEDRTARSRRTPTSRHAGVERAAARRGRAAHRARPPRRAGRRGDLARGPEGGRGFLAGSATRRPGARRRTRPRSAGRTSPATHPTRSRRRSPAWSCAADMASEARRRKALAQHVARRSRTGGRRRVEDWTVTTNGPLSDRALLPAADQERRAGHRRPRTPWVTAARTAIDQRAVVDPSFLDLVRYGIPRPTTRRCFEPLAGRRRRAAGRPPRTGRSGTGSATTGTARRRTGGAVGDHRPRHRSPRSAAAGRCSPASGASTPSPRAGRGRRTWPRWRPPPADSGLISEQVWDGRPPTGDPCCPAGEGTRAATPLTWSHAGLVRLAWTIQRGAPVDQQGLVAGRYQH